MAHREAPPFVLVEHAALNEYRAHEGHEASAPGAELAGAPMTHTRGLTLVEQYETIRVGSIRRDRSGALVSESSAQPLRGGRREQARERHVSVTAILVLAGMPWLLTGAVLAHELMHAWLRMEGYRELPPPVEEGLCQLMAYLWLEAQQLQARSSSAHRKRNEYVCAVCLWAPL